MKLQKDLSKAEREKYANVDKRRENQKKREYSSLVDPDKFSDMEIGEELHWEMVMMMG